MFPSNDSMRNKKDMKFLFTEENYTFSFLVLKFG